MGNVSSSDSEEEAPSPPSVVARGRRHQQPAKESSHQHHHPAVPVAGATVAVGKNQAKKRALRSLSPNRTAVRGDAKKPTTAKSRPQRSRVILPSHAPPAAKEEAGEESKTKVPVLPTKKKQSTWNARYRELVRFKRDHGHCRVPQIGHEVLQKWLYEQKRRREGPFQGQPQLSQAEFDKLEAVGITWTYRKTWKQNLEHLVRFQQIHGHCEVPTTNADLQPLAEWVNVQKHRRVGTYKKQSQLTLDMIAKLDAIGFEWGLPEDDDDDDDDKEQDRTSETVNASPVRLKSSSRSRAVKHSGTGSSRQNSRPTTQAKKKARTMGIAKSDDDEEDLGFACKVHWMESSDGTTTSEVGFILLPSRAFTTFADARQCIGDILVDTEESSDWVFHLPVLGAVSKKQETALGSMWNFLKKADPMGNENFTCEGDAKVIVAKREPVLL